MTDDQIPDYLKFKDATNWHRDFINSMSDRELAFFLLHGEQDYDAQGSAIRSFLRHRRIDDEQFEAELASIEEFSKKARGAASEQADMEYVDHLHGKIFLDAAHSMAAVGMLAPFIESIFEHSFYGIRELFSRENLQMLSANRLAMEEGKRWDCHYLANGEKQLVQGIFELANATGLDGYLPSDLRVTLEALYGYRNKNFHLGFEWPLAERTKFVRRISADGWPNDWFENSSSDHKPWIFYMSDVFIRHCLESVEAVMEALGRFYREKSAQ